MRKVFLEELPRYKNKIDWKNCMGYIINFVYDYIEGRLEIIDYNKENQYVYLKHVEKNVYKTMHSNCLINCNLGILLGKITGDFKIDIGTRLKDNNRDITITDRKTEYRYKKDGSSCLEKMYKYKCNKCGFECGGHYNNGEYKEEHWMLESNLLKGSGCSCCCNPPRILVQGINDIPTTDPWMIKFFKNQGDANNYTKSSGRKIIMVCPDCGIEKEVKISDFYNRKSIGCICGDGFSYPNKFMFNLLKQLNINFTSEYSPEWIGLKRYDFYIPSKNLIIEMDGKLGHGKNVLKNSNRTIEETKADDDYKDMMAKNHNIEVIRIDSDVSQMEYIKNNIINSRIPILLDLSNINWFEIEECALSSRVKEACELKRNNPEMTTVEIKKIMNLGSLHTVIKYLKKGTKLGWCNYDPIEESKKGYKKAGDSTKRRNRKILKCLENQINKESA